MIIFVYMKRTLVRIENASFQHEKNNSQGFTMTKILVYLWFQKIGFRSLFVLLHIGPAMLVPFFEERIFSNPNWKLAPFYRTSSFPPILYWMSGPVLKDHIFFDPVLKWHTFTNKYIFFQSYTSLNFNHWWTFSIQIYLLYTSSNSTYCWTCSLQSILNV